MVYRVRKQLVEEGLEAVLSRKAPAAPAVPRIFDGEKEARLIRALELTAVGDEGGGARHRPGRQRQHDPARAQKNALQPHRRKYWVIPPKASGAFVAAMEDVLSVYTRPGDPDRPVVCRRNPLAGRDAAGATGPRRLRICAQRRGQPVHDVRPARRLAQRQGHRPPHRRRLRPRPERPGRRSLRASRVDRPHPGQSQHPRRRIALPSLSRRRGQGAWSSASNGITRRNTAPGWSWPNPNSASSPRSVSTGASPTSRQSSTRSPPESATETTTTPPPNGASQPTTPASNSRAYTLRYDRIAPLDCRVDPAE